jgi:peptide/nickel transport system substrate-binding protein
MKSDSYTLTHMGSAIQGSANLVKACRESLYETCPGLAEKWETNSDFTQWTFKIRDNVLWHDGAPFTTEDVKFWYDLGVFGVKAQGKTRTPSIFQVNMGDVKKVEVLPGNRVRVTLENPAPQYLVELREPRVSIAHPKHLMQPFIDKGEVTVAAQDVGFVATGPFKMLQYERGSRVQLRRFDRFWEKDEKGRQLPFLDGIEFAIITDPGAMDAAFRVGRLDGGARGTPMELTPERQAGYVRDLGDQVWFAVIASPVGGLNFNVLKPGPWQDVRVRKAIALWLDKEAGVKLLYGGAAVVGTLLHPKNPFTDPNFVTWPGYSRVNREGDRAEAKRLLAAAGHPNGFNMYIYLPRRWTDFGVFAQGQLTGLINLELRLVDDATFQAGQLTLDHDMLWAGVSGGAIIPEATAVNFNAWSKTKYGRPKHDDPKVIDHFDRLNRSSDFNERVRIWREFERYFLAEQFYTVLVAGQNTTFPYRSYVKGMVVPQERIHEYLDFATVWLDK